MIDANSIEKSSSVSSPDKATGLDEKKKAKLQKAVQEFESLFVGYLLKTMRSTVPKSDMFGESFGGDILEGMFDMEMAKHISRNSGLGVGEMLYRQMTGEKLSPHVGRNLQEMRLPTGRASVDTVGQRVGKFGQMIQEAADQHSLDINLLKAVIATESGGKADAASDKDAKGLMQLIDSTAADMGVKDVWDPRENILGGAKYLRQMLDRFDGNLEFAIASYNAGPTAVEKYQGIPPYKETKEYVRKVMDYMHEFESEGTDE
ncbi:MAG TPA: murein transglycosylase [Bacteroidetes bacterium]|jgi:Rod binding domain-containing protein|nr:murein transglycosylase [Bacteroidota bacterium]